MAELQRLPARIEDFLKELSPDDLRALVVRSARKMDGPHRAQLALYLGYDATRHPIDEFGFGVDSGELQKFVDGCPLLRERFAAFLTDNPRAISAFGKHTAQTILGDDAGEQRNGFGSRAWIAAAAAAAILLFAVLPLAAEYAHQRVMNSGAEYELSAPVQPAAAAQIRRAPVAARRGEPSRVAHRAMPGQHPQPPQTTRAIAAAPAVSRPRTVALVKHSPIEHRAATHAVKPRPRKRAPAVNANRDLAQARFVVGYYLTAVMHGDTAIALMPLGLPSDASPDAITEHRILTPDSTVRVVSAQREDDGRVRVIANIAGPRGTYSEVFYLAKAAGTIRIVDRYYSAVAVANRKGRVATL